MLVPLLLCYMRPSSSKTCGQGSFSSREWHTAELALPQGVPYWTGVCAGTAVSLNVPSSTLRNVPWSVPGKHTQVTQVSPMFYNNFMGQLWHVAMLMMLMILPWSNKGYHFPDMKDEPDLSSDHGTKIDQMQDFHGH